ncbi:MAG TPA: hypothetical protein PKW90_03245, partial [Myxococcota bacterium]|nr:hypothetical protein [Myxococcota bacterium]
MVKGWRKARSGWRLGSASIDADRAIPILKKVLARREKCSEVLRRKAVFLVSQKRTDETESILLDAA